MSSYYDSYGSSNVGDSPILDPSMHINTVGWVPTSTYQEYETREYPSYNPLMNTYTMTPNQSQQSDSSHGSGTSRYIQQLPTSPFDPPFSSQSQYAGGYIVSDPYVAQSPTANTSMEAAPKYVPSSHSSMKPMVLFFGYPSRLRSILITYLSFLELRRRILAFTRAVHPIPYLNVAPIWRDT